MEFDEAFRDETTSDVTSYQPINFATDVSDSNITMIDTTKIIVGFKTFQCQVDLG